MQKIKILFLEDNEDDVLLVNRLLKKGGFLVEYKIVQDQNEFKNALFLEWDLIIADFNLPSFSGIDALEIYKQKKLDIPFILVSGIIGEEIAVDAMKKGAHDYLKKDNLQRLVPAIKRELKEYKIRVKNKIAAEQIKESETRYRELVESSPVGIIIISSSKIIFANPSAIRMLKYENLNKLLQKEIGDILIKSPSSKKYLQLQNESDSHFEAKMFCADGSFIYADVSTVSITFNDKSSIQINFNDITSRKILEFNYKKLNNALIQSPIAIAITDTKGKPEYLNPKFISQTGYSIDEIKGKELDIFKRGYLTEEKYKSLMKAVFNSQVWFNEAKCKKKNGEYFWQNIKVAPIVDEHELTTHLVVLMEDITERKKMEVELIQAKEKAIQSEKLKSEFLAQMSHEIRSPINVVLSFTNLLKEEIYDKIDDELKDGFKIIDAAGRRIIRTIDLILNMSEIQTNTFELVPKQINIVEEILEPLVQEYKHLALEKGLNLILNKNTDKTLVYADEYSMSQIFANLIHNAINYTEKGEINLIVSDLSSDKLQIEIKDTGIGISEEYLPNLFTPFSQEEQGYSRRYEGNGLGLALVKNYCDLNKAKIAVESQKGKGSNFIIELEKIKTKIYNPSE